MANMLTIEVGTAEIRVAEMRDDKKGSSIRRCFRFAVPQGLVEDGLVRDAGGLGEQLKNELLSRKISARKVRFLSLRYQEVLNILLHALFRLPLRLQTSLQCHQILLLLLLLQKLRTYLSTHSSHRLLLPEGSQS